MGQVVSTLSEWQGHKGDDAMNPDTLLSMLVQARNQMPAEPNTPFLLQTRGLPAAQLVHPLLPGGGISVDASCRTALESLVQWGYLAQSEHARGLEFVLTGAGLDYAARLDGRWDGTERRQQERRTGRGLPLGVDERPTERRRVERRVDPE